MEQANAVRAADLAAIAVNNAGIPIIKEGREIFPAFAPWADMLYASDVTWWRHHAEHAMKFEGIKACCMETEFKNVHLIRQSGCEGFDPQINRVRTGGNSGYAACHIAIQQGASRVLLLGFDMGGTHYFGKHGVGMRNTDADTFKRWIERFRALNNQGAEIINCTPGSALKCFPSMTLESAMNA